MKQTYKSLLKSNIYVIYDEWKIWKYIKKDSEILDKIKRFIRKDLDVDVIHKSKWITANVKPYYNEIKTNFHDEWLPPEQTPCLM